MPHKLNFTFVTITLCTRIILCPQLEAGTIYVTPDGTGDGSTWGMSKGSITAALISSVSGDEIWVASGTYMEAITMKTGVNLYGGFMGNETAVTQRNWVVNSTIINATGKNTSVVIGSNNTIMDGFTITGGKSDLGGGLYCKSSSPTLNNCFITGNLGPVSGGGMYCSDNSSPKLFNCTITGNSAPGKNSQQPGYGGGVCCYASSPILTNCIVSDNLATGMYLVYSKPIYIPIYGSGGGIFCSDNSFPVLNNCTINKNSTYRSGGGGDFVSSSPSFNNCIISENSAIYFDGGGIHCYSCFLTMTKCTITGNSAGKCGSGMYCDYSSSTISDCTITGNLGSGVDCTRSNESLINNCTINGNSGGGVICTKSSPTITNCIITGNSASVGGGVNCLDNSSANLTNCTISGNLAASGGGIYCSASSPIQMNCTITSNLAESGGGIYCIASSPIQMNCTITSNLAESGGGIYCDYDSFPKLTNCIMWNHNNEIVGWGSPKVTYSCIEDGYAGISNIQADPLFIDPANGDFHLQPNSPCIDSGIPTVEMNDGCLPPGQGTVLNDMGAYGGPGNCGWLEEGINETPTPTHTPSPTATPQPAEVNDWGFYQ